MLLNKKSQRITTGSLFHNPDFATHRLMVQNPKSGTQTTSLNSRMILLNPKYATHRKQNYVPQFQTHVFQTHRFVTIIIPAPILPNQIQTMIH